MKHEAGRGLAEMDLIKSFGLDLKTVLGSPAAAHIFL